MLWNCKECLHQNELDIKSNALYSRVICHNCSKDYYQCHHCTTKHDGRRPYRIKKHVQKCQPANNAYVIPPPPSIVDPNNVPIIEGANHNDEYDVDFFNSDIAINHNEDLDGDSLNTPTSDSRTNDSDDNDDYEISNEEVEAQEFVDNLLNLFEDDDDTISTLDVCDDSGQYNVGHTFDATNMGDTTVMSLNEFKPFSNDETNAYFWQNYVCQKVDDENNGGLRGMAWRTVYRKKLYGKNNLASTDDTRLLFNMTDHMMNNTAEQQDTFFEILEDILGRGQGIDADIQIPITKKEANAILLEGRFGLFGNIPHEPVMDIGGHACISLIGLFKHLNAHGVPIAYSEYPSNEDPLGSVRETSEIHGCPAMTDLLNEMKSMNVDNCPSHYGYMILWSDGFLRSFVKQKDNSVWILTVTFPDPDGNSTSPFHTHCIAIGSSKLDHTPVINFYLKEIEMLMKGVNVFCGINNVMKRVQMGLIAYVADRPERSALMKTSHLGNYGKRSLWSSFVDENHLPFCKRCFNQEIESILNDRYGSSILLPCGRCCQWDMESTSASNNKIPTEEKYPKRFDVDSPECPEGRPVGLRFAKPVQLSFEWLTKAIKFAQHNVQSKCWNKGVMTAYLQTCAVPGAVRNYIWTTFKDGNEEEDIDESIAENMVVTENVYENHIPKIWLAAFAIGAFIDAGMHHIFHGVVAECIIQTQQFMADHSLQAKFEKIVNPILLEIQTLRLDWCRVKILPKKQWLAEDILGFSRIAPFIYAQFFKNLSLPPSSNTTPSCLIAIQQMFNALHVLVSILMSPRDPNIALIDRHIKIFLSCCHRYSRSYYDERVEPFWASTGNFPSLLNLTNQIKRNGPIRWYWEGTRERFIQTVKKVLLSMRRSSSYFTRKLIIIQKLNTMEWLKKSIRRRRTAGKKDYTRMYYRYESYAEIAKKFGEGKVLSAFTMKNSQQWVFVAFGEKGCKMSFIGLSLEHFDTHIKDCGFVYGKCELDDEIDVLKDETRVDVEEMIDNYCLLLPGGPCNELNHGFCAIVFHDWDVMLGSTEKNIPCLCETLFSNNVMPT